VPTDDSLYLEALAVDLVQAWIGTQGEATHLGGSNEDFRIKYEDGRTAIGEIKRGADARVEEMRTLLEKMSPPHSLPLRPGLGTWVASITTRTPLTTLGQELSDVAEHLLQEGVANVEIYDSWPHGTIYNRLRALSMRRLWRPESQGPDEVVLFPEPTGGAVPLTCEPLCEWINQYLAQAADRRSLSNSLRRLEHSAADERHLFLWAEEALPSEVLLYMSFHPDAPPTDQPNLPDYLTHLWLATRFSFAEGRCLWLFRPNQGWQAAPGLVVGAN
jgi:hypothetical protein